MKKDLFKKIGDIKGTFHLRMGTIKEKNWKDLTKAEGIKKRWQEYTEKLYKKVLMTHLEPDILEYEFIWALGSITMNKYSGSGRFPAELLKILKDDAFKVLHSTCQQIWKTQQWQQD